MKNPNTITISLQVPVTRGYSADKLEQGKVFAALRLEKFFELILACEDNPRCINELLLELDGEMKDIVKYVLRDKPFLVDYEIGDMCSKSWAWSFLLKYQMADFGRTAMIQTPILYK